MLNRATCKVAEIITFNITFAVFFPLTVVAEEYIFSIIPSPTSPHFGILISFIAVAGLLALFPLEYLLSRCGFSIWPAQPVGSSAGQITLPTIRDSWWILLITLVILVGALAWTINQLG